MTQTDHSRLAGFMASHWGNSTFAPLQPYESVARARDVPRLRLAAV
jgi:hypothetical protein